MIGETEPLTPPISSRINLKSISSMGIPILLTVAAVVLWFGSLDSINLREMTDLGLVSVLPSTCFIALLILLLSFCMSLHGDLAGHRETFLYAYVIVLIVLLYGITSFIEDIPRVPVTWLHAGFTEYIMRTGTLATEIDARFSWPGFFTANALLTEIAGLENPIAYAGWAPLVFNLMYLFPLLMIMRALTTDKRLVWTAIWFFYLTNWIGQDYYSPQGLNFFLYLVILGVVLRWFKANETSIVDYRERLNVRLSGRIRWLHRFLILTIRDTPNVAVGSFERAGLILIIVVIFTAIASSHQLTPVALIFALGALVVFNRSDLRALPILFGVIAVTWISFMTVDYLSGHVTGLLEEVGNIFGSMNANVTGRLKGSDEHQLVLTFRLGMTLAIWVLAFLGNLRRMFMGHLNLTGMLLICAPFPILGLNSYGGEALLRVYLFALPFAVFLAATLIYPLPETRASVFRTIALGTLSLLLLSGYLFARYGNERVDYMTLNEAAAFHYLYDHAPPGSRFVIASHNNPGRYRDIEKYHFSPDLDEFLLADTADLIDAMKTGSSSHNYLILTRGQEAYGELFYGQAPGWADRLVEALLATNQLEVLYRNPDAIILVLMEDVQ